MRKKQTITAVLHPASAPLAIEDLQKKISDFYIRQVETQIGKYDITKEQRQQVIAALALEYRSKP